MNDVKCTSTAESRDVMARISAQETVFGQAHSSILLMVSMTSKPLAELLLPPMFFSVTIPGASSNKIDPSHPCTTNSRHKHLLFISQTEQRSCKYSNTLVSTDDLSHGSVAQHWLDKDHIKATYSFHLDQK